MEALTKYAENFSECPNAFKYLESLTIARSCYCHDSNYIETSDITYLNTFPIVFDNENPQIHYYLILFIAKCPHCNQITTCGIIYDEDEDNTVTTRCLHSDVLLNMYHVFRNFSPRDTLINPMMHPVLFMDTTLSNLVKYYIFQQSVKCKLNYSLANYSSLLAKTVAFLKIPEELRQIINNYTLLNTVNKISYVTMVACIYQNIPYNTMKQLLQTDTDTTPARPLRKIYVRKEPFPNFSLDTLDM